MPINIDPRASLNNQGAGSSVSDYQRGLLKSEQGYSPFWRTMAIGAVGATALQMHASALRTLPSYASNLYHLAERFEEMTPFRWGRTFGLSERASSYVLNEIRFTPGQLIAGNQLTELGSHFQRLLGSQVDVAAMAPGGIHFFRTEKASPFLRLEGLESAKVRFSKIGRFAGASARYNRPLESRSFFWNQSQSFTTRIWENYRSIRESQMPFNPIRGVKGLGADLKYAPWYASTEATAETSLADRIAIGANNLRRSVEPQAFELLERPQKMLAEIGIGLRQGSFNKLFHVPFVGEGGLINGVLLKRVLPIAIGLTAIRYLDYKTGHVGSNATINAPLKANLLRADLTDILPGGRSITDWYAREEGDLPQYAPFALPLGGMFIGGLIHFGKVLTGKFPGVARYSRRTRDIASRILPRMSVLKRAARAGTVGEAVKLGWKAFGTPGKGGLIGLALMLPFVPGMLGSRKTGTELRRIYSGEQEIPIRQGRWWEVGSTKWSGNRIIAWRPHASVLMKSHAREKSLYGSEENYWSHNPILHPFKWLKDPYYLEKLHEADRPYPITSPAFSNVPLIGSFLAATIGKVVKPSLRMHTDEWDAGSDYTLYSSRLEPRGPQALPPAVPEHEFSLWHAFKREAFTMSDYIGLPGFIMRSIYGKAYPGTGKQPVYLQGSRQMDSTSRAYYEQNIGSGYFISPEGAFMGYTEPLRRFIQPEGYTPQVNEIRNTMPSWMPGADYLIDFSKGDPYCVSPETIVEVGIIGFEHAVNVTNEDLVLSHLGNALPVKAKKTRSLGAEEKAYKLKVVSLSAVDLIFSQEHPILVFDGQNSNSKESGLVWKPVRSLKKGDYVAYPRPKFETHIVNISFKAPYDKRKHKEIDWFVDLTPDIGYLFGLYLAEGHTQEGVVGFSLHAKERSYFDRALIGARQLLPYVGGYFAPIKDTNGAYAWIYSKGLSNLLESLFGKGAENKSLPDFVAELPEDCLVGLLRGYFDGDGCEFTSGDGKYRVAASSCSLTLLLQIRKLLLARGWVGSIIRKNPPLEPSIYDGKEIHSGQNYSLSYRGSVGVALSKFLGYDPPLAPAYSAAWTFSTSNYIGLRVLGIEEVESKEVIGFEVDDDDSFCVAGIATHNTKVDQGFARLPGAGYEALHPEIEGLNPEDYPNIHKMRILADVAPYSREYQRWSSIVRHEAKDNPDLQTEYERIIEQVKQTKESTLQLATKHFNAPIDTLEGTVKSASFEEGVQLAEYPGRTFRFSSVGGSMADLTAEMLGSSNTVTRSQAVRQADIQTDMRREYLADVLAEGTHVKLVVPRGAAANSSDIRAVIMADNLNVNRAMIEQGYGRFRQDLGGAEEQAMHGWFGRLFGKYTEEMFFEGDQSPYNPMRYVPTPFHTKLAQERTPLSQYIQQEVIGTRMRRWNRPIHDFLQTYMRGLAARVSGVDEIPKDIQRRRDLDTLTDMLAFLRGEESAATSDEDRGRYTSQAKRTNIGANLYGSASFITSTLSSREARYFKQFVQETDPEVRERILGVVPEESRLALEAQWELQKERIAEAEGQPRKELGAQGRPYTEEDVEEYKTAKTQLQLGDYLRSRQIARFFFTRKFHLPTEEDSAALDSNLDYQDVKLKLVQQEGYDAHDFNLFQDRADTLWRKPYVDGAVRELTSGDSRTQEQMRQAVEQIIISAGNPNPDVRYTTRKAHRSRANVTVDADTDYEHDMLVDMRRNTAEYQE